MDTADLIRRYWTACNARDWEAFAATFADDVRYRCPQTRELVRGKPAYLAFNQEYPGDWTLTIDRIVADGTGGVSWTTFRVGEEVMTGLCFFTVDADGLIAQIDDFWPEPYEPPAGRAHLVERY